MWQRLSSYAHHSLDSRVCGIYGSISLWPQRWSTNKGSALYIEPHKNVSEMLCNNQIKIACSFYIRLNSNLLKFNSRYALDAPVDGANKFNTSWYSRRYQEDRHYIGHDHVKILYRHERLKLIATMLIYSIFRLRPLEVTDRDNYF